MTRVVVSRDMPASPSVVWAALADLESHPVWMRDARSVAFTSDQTSGVGTRMEVATVIGPFRTTDVMEVVSWEEGRSIGVVHQGLVTGRGTLSLDSGTVPTTVTWDETLTFPWWLGGAVTAWLARPVLAAVWRGNLRRLEDSLG
ncbi:MAG: SRPBCC family protein [Acidimicrobiia bacterium]